MGLGEHFPWQSIEALLDHRLEPSGRSFEQFRASTIMDMPVPKFRKYRKTGFATPSGKVELASSILEDLGFDPLPYHRPAPAPTPEYPYLVFSGVREDPFFQTGQRNIGVLRRRMPAPHFFVHPEDAARDGLNDGTWARLETEHGHVYAKVSVQEGMRPGHLRVPTAGGTRRPAAASISRGPSFRRTRCSPLAVIDSAGATMQSERRRASSSARARAITVSVSSGRWGPCCSHDPTGTTTIGAPTSGQVISLSCIGLDDTHGST